MKKETLHRHINIANDVMYYIYSHIDTHIDVEELSRDLHVSRFHMQRIFKEMFDQNIYESIKSIRLQKASNLLLTNRYSTVSNIANLCGYSSQSSFIKAFKDRFGMTPKTWRSGGYRRYSQTILEQSPRAMESTAEFGGMTPEIVKMPVMKSYYLRNRGYDVNVKQTWQKIQTWILGNGLETYTQIALFHDNPAITPLDECQYIACVTTQETDKITSDRLPKFEISGGVYAKFDLEGRQGDLLKFIRWVYHEWLPASEFETTTLPSYAIFRKNKYLSGDEMFDLSFYVSIRF